ncbi:MAG: glycine zipper 2TM domain-containing protein [Oxalobacteraceae bacterium]|nr:MAG: glycine zipper 2TM domain-containing protein [Oxalobacteraceae bacterium]
MITRAAIALLLSSATAIFSLSASAQDSRYDPRYQQDYRNPPPAYAPPPVPMAVPAAVFQDNARVLRVTPRLEQVSSPQEECRMEIERVAPPQNAGQGHSLGGAIVGGLAGGILGNQVGGGSGRTAATALGAVGGALVGDRVGGNLDNQAQYGPVERQVQRCTVVNRVIERNAGYDVSYTYNGRTYNTVMPNDPGTNLRVNVAITPVSGY